MNQHPITTAEYNALPDKKKELYSEVWEFKSKDNPNWSVEHDKEDYNSFQDFADSLQWGFIARQRYYPKPEANQQPTQQNAPLINEGGETMEEAAGKHLKNIAGFYHGKEADLIKEDFVSGAKWQKATTQKEVTTLQTALAEATNKIAELERRLTPNSHE